MSEPEPFLARWSRRKREIEKDDAQDVVGTSAPEGAKELAETQPVEIANAEKQISPKVETPAFDPASLPPIEDIGVGTDIRAFLAQIGTRRFRSTMRNRLYQRDAAKGKCPQRDSNPRYSLERAVTWTASRWGR